MGFKLTFENQNSLDLFTRIFLMDILMLVENGNIKAIL